MADFEWWPMPAAIPIAAMTVVGSNSNEESFSGERERDREVCHG